MSDKPSDNDASPREMTAAEACEIGVRTGRCGPYLVEHHGDWPMPNPPPFPADDEGKP